MSAKPAPKRAPKPKSQTKPSPKPVPFPHAPAERIRLSDQSDKPKAVSYSWSPVRKITANPSGGRVRMTRGSRKVKVSHVSDVSPSWQHFK